MSGSYPEVLDRSRVGSYPALAKAGGGFVWDVHMKKASVIYLSAYEPTPISFWVHRHFDAEAWVDAVRFEPPLPVPA